MLRSGASHDNTENFTTATMASDADLVVDASSRRQARTY